MLGSNIGIWVRIYKEFENYCFVLLTNRVPPQISDNRPDMRQRAFCGWYLHISLYFNVRLEIWVASFRS